MIRARADAPPIEVVDAPLALLGWLPTWDVERRRVDATAVIEWTLARLREWGEKPDTLAAIDVDGDRARQLAQQLTRASLSIEFRGALHRSLRAAIPELHWDRIWVQTYAHYRILVAGDPIAPTPAHTDHGFGHGLDERNIWLGLSDASGDAAPHLWNLDESLAWLSRNGAFRSVLADAGTLVPRPTTAGEALLFTPLHVRGARMPRAGSRVSIDIRIVPARSGRPDYSFSPMRRI